MNKRLAGFIALAPLALASCGFTEYGYVSLEPVAGATSPFSENCQVIKINDLVADASEDRFKNAKYPVYLGKTPALPHLYDVECGVMQNGIYKKTGQATYDPMPGKISFGSPEGTNAQNIGRVFKNSIEGIYPYVTTYTYECRLC